MMNLLIALVCTVDGAVVYQWVDVDGVTHYTNNPSTIPAGATVTPATGQDINVISVDQTDAEPEAPAAAQPADEEETEPDQLPPDAQLSPEEQAAQQQAIAEQQGQVNSVSEFEAPLAASGQWMDVDGYRVWQPSASIVGSDFVPYQTNGHWEWTSAGWVFVSDYDWGWAAFHYGRWWQSPSYGWLWYPGLAWSPAWVSWRVGGGYAGWAPLWPRHIRWHPRWCFVPTQHMGDVAFHRYALHGPGYGLAFHSTARLPFQAHGPSVAGVQRWGGSVPMGSLNRSGYGYRASPSAGGFRAPPSVGYGGYRAAPPSVGYGGYRAAPPSVGGYRAPPPSEGSYRAPPPSVGGFRAPPSSGEFRAPPSAGGYRAPPPSVGGFRGGYSAPHSGSFGGSSGGGFHSAPSFGGAHSGGGGFHGGGSPSGGHFGGGGHGRH